MEKTELVVQFAHILNLIAVNLFRLTRLGILYDTRPVSSSTCGLPSVTIVLPSVVLTAWFEEQPATVNSAAAVN